MAFKKSLFSKPSWAVKAAAPVDVDQPIFQQSANIHEQIVEANRKKQERRVARQKQKEEDRRRKSDSRDTKFDQDDKPVKKQRISTEPIRVPDDDDHDFDRRKSDSDSDRSSRSSRSRQRRTSTPEREQEKPLLRSAPKDATRKTSGLEFGSPRKPRKAATPLNEDDDFAVVDVQPAPSKPIPKQKLKPPPPPESESDPEEDDYLKELKRQARAESKLKRSANTMPQHAVSPTADGKSPPVDLPPGTSLSGSATPTAGGHDPADPEVQILITSLIPNCHDLIVKRRASQPLAQVLAYYAEKYELGYLGTRLFFTWNDTRLYKSTTMRSILAMIRTKYGTKKDGSDVAEGRIEIKAVTDEVHEARLAFKERERKRMENGGEDPEPPPADYQSSEAPAQTGEPPQRPAGTIIQLKSNEDASLPNMNLRVHPHTTIDKIVRGYKRKMQVDVNREVYLVFDGERLEEDQTVADVGFEDGDAVDVRAKS